MLLLSLSSAALGVNVIELRALEDVLVGCVKTKTRDIPIFDWFHCILWSNRVTFSKLPVFSSF